MYYDPMISKLITWGKDRKEAMDLIDNAFDEYVVQGVGHNLGFGKSIVHNEKFAEGDYTTAFIPDFYPDGYSGDALTSKQENTLAMACHKLKNQYLKYSNPSSDKSVVYCRIFGDETDKDFKVEQSGS